MASTDTPEKGESPAGLRSRWGTWCHRAILFVLTAGVVTQFTLRDHIEWLALFYYALPLPVCLVGFGITAIWHFRKKRRNYAVFALLAAIGCTGLILTVDWNRPEASSPPTDQTLTVVCWNAFHGRLGGARVIRAARAMEPDVAIFLEGAELMEQDEPWAEEFPDHRVVPFGEDQRVLVVSRGSISSTRIRRLGDRSRVATCQVKIDGVRWNLVVADLNPQHDSLFRRREVFELLDEYLETLSLDERTILVGDFNTPRRSVHCDALRVKWHLRDAFSVAGRGLPYSWPLPLPVLDIDHAWTSPDVIVHDADLRLTTASDHCAVVLEVSQQP